MSETLTTTTVNTNCTVTNNSGVAVTVLNAIADATTTTPELMYEQILKIVPAAAGNIIKAATTGTIVLNDTHVDKNGVTQFNSLYDLLMVKPDTLFPVLVTSATLSFGSDRKFPPITIAADAANNMTLAENFWQTIMAFPTSKLANDYMAASTAATDTATSDTSIDATVNAFFKTTDKYKTVTNDMVVAVHTYYETYPYGWADYQTGKTYYLYTSDETKTTYVGSVELNIPATVAANIDKSLPGMTLTYTNASGNKKNLYYKDGLFVDDAHADLPAVSLKGLFTLKSNLTKDAADNKIISVLSGTVNYNQTVLGYNEKLKQNPDGSWSGMYTLLHPNDFMGYLQLFMTGMGVIMGIEVIVKGVKGLKDKFTSKKVENGGKDPSPSEIDELKAEFRDMKAKMLENNQELLDKMNEGQKVAEDMNTSINELQQEIQDRFNEDQRTTLEESLNQEGGLLNDAAQYEVTPEMETIGDSIQENIERLDGAATSDLASALPEVKASVESINADLAVEVQTVSAEVSQEAQQEFKEAQEELKTAEETADAIEENSKNAEEGGTPEDVEFESEMKFEA